MSSTADFNTIVIGAGQAGLASGYFLKQRGHDFVILDENSHIGTSWRTRWDSLRLFTPSQLNSLPGMNFPKPDFYFPTKNEAADYLESYASRFSLPVQSGIKVNSLQRNEAGYLLSSDGANYHARNVIIATGAFRTPYIPAYAQKLPVQIRQLHSVTYHNPDDLQVQHVAVIGAGNSGAEIALELAKNGRKVWLAGRDVGTAPLKRFGRLLGGKPIKWFLRRVATIDTPIGRKMRPNAIAHGTPLVRTQRADIKKMGIELTARLADIQDGKLILEGGKVLQVEGVVWSTGFRPDYEWIKLPIFDTAGRPLHERGVVTLSPGLFFVGLHFQTRFASALLSGVGDDAEFITGRIH